MDRLWCQLKDIADVHLGYKSLQNDFFYLSEDTVQQFGIEKEYLRDMFLLPDFDGQRFLQSPTQSTWLFHCRNSEADLRGTGALRYIRTMAKRPATVTKQASGKRLTIQDVLTEQGGGRWYSPKAMPQSSHIWLRKAFAGVFAPFLFAKPATVDQRCNRVEPLDGIPWEELAALMTTSLFALSLEADGAFSMGGGALEWKTKSLRGARVIDIRRFSDEERLQLVKLAKNVWLNTKPVDFSKPLKSNKPLRVLDSYVLKLIGQPINADELYSDLHSTVSGRIEKAKGRKAGSKIREVANIQEIAASIANVIRPSLEAHRFPEDFCALNGRQQIIDMPPDRELIVTAERFMSNGHLKVEDVQGNVFLEIDNTAILVEIVLRALLLGRRRFSIPVEAEAASTAIAGVFPWLHSISAEIEEGVRSSALGTRFEGQLKVAVFNELNIVDAGFSHELWGSYHVPKTP